MALLVYVADGCPHCAALLADLSRRRVGATVINLTREPARVEELAQLTWERRVPVVVDHERCSVGFAGGSTRLGDPGLGGSSGLLSS